MANKPKTWFVRVPDTDPALPDGESGQVVKVTNLKTFCKERGLDYNVMWSMLNSITPNPRPYKGYSKGGPSPTEHIAEDVLALHNLDGRKTGFMRNRTQLAKTAGISLSSLRRLMNGQAKWVMGWQLKYLVIDIEGEEDI